MGVTKPMCILATGGYGRGELSPLSDIDLMFLYPKSSMGKSLDNLKEIMTREILYPLWDSGLKVGHASREINEALSESQKDIRNKNSMLDSASYVETEKIAQKFIAKFLKFCRRNQPLLYLNELLRHQTERRESKGSTIFLQAPDVKNGVGGLRDYQGILWMSKVKFNLESLKGLIERQYLTENEANSFEESYSFLLRVRNELHFRSTRPVDILHLENSLKSHLDLATIMMIFLGVLKPSWRDYYTKAQTIYQICGILEERLVTAKTGNTSKLSFFKMFLKLIDHLR